MEKQKFYMPASLLIKILVCLAVIAAFWVAPPVAPLTAVGMRVIGIFIGVILMLSIVDTVWPAMLAIVLLGESGVCTCLLYTSMRGATVSVLCVFGHRDDEAARWAAKYLATELKCNVSVAVGIHIDHADGSEIQCLLENCREACTQFKDRVRADRLS